MTLEQSSFLAGLQAGYRLGRPPEGRKPPAPSGRYILTESGEPMLTEIGTMSDITIIDPNSWYQTNYDNDVLAYRASAEWVESGHSAICIVADLQNGEGRHFTWVFKEEDRPTRANVWIRQIDPPGPDLGGPYPLVISSLAEGYEYGQVLGTVIIGTFENVTPFYGTTSELWEWVQHLKSLPMVTE